MNLFEDAQARQELEHLHRLAMDANDEGQYATMERLLEQAVATAQRLDNLPLLVKEREWLADAQRMQSKDTQALATFTWLIGLASDPARSHQVSDEDSLWYIEYLFSLFSRGKSLPVYLPYRYSSGRISTNLRNHSTIFSQYTIYWFGLLVPMCQEPGMRANSTGTLPIILSAM